MVILYIRSFDLQEYTTADEAVEDISLSDFHG